MTKQYELMVLLPVSLTQDQIAGFIKTVRTMVESKGGKVVEDQQLGRRTLAYEIAKQRDAYYLLFVIDLDTSAAQAVEREIRLTEHVLRSLFVIREEQE